MVEKGHCSFKELELADVHLVGRLSDGIRPNEAVLAHARKFGAKKLYCLAPPTEPDDDHWHKVITPADEKEQGPFRAEGAMLSRPGDCLAIPSRDCPIVVVEHPRMGILGAAHAGRDSLVKKFETGPRSVLHELLDRMGIRYEDVTSRVQIYVTGGISAEHFGHDDPEVVAPFRIFCGRKTVVDEAGLNLDLYVVIQEIVKTRGVRCDRIRHDGLCTYTEEWLGSKRAKRPGHNWTFVVRKK